MAAASILAALLYLAALGVSGVAALRRLRCALTPLEIWAYGLPLGNVTWSLIVLLGAVGARRLTLPIVLAPAIASLALALALWPARELLATLRGWRGLSPARLARRAVDALGPFSALVLAAFALRWTAFWGGALGYDATGALWAGHTNLWSDWALHLGDVTAFVYGDNFPPTLTRYAGAPLAYHYLPSVTAAALVKLGLSPPSALALHSWACSLPLLLSLYAFALRLLRDRAAAVAAVVLFLLGGTLAWLPRLAALAGASDPLGAFLRLPWDREIPIAANLSWPSIFFDLLAPQRAYAYGLPLALLVLTLLLGGQATQDRRRFLAAGVVAGLLPFAHTSTLVALALIVPFAFLTLAPATAPLPRHKPTLRARYRRTVGGRLVRIARDYAAALPDWLLFGFAWVALAAPQLYLQQDGQRGETRAIRWQLGWVAAPDPWPWYWLKNLGLFVPLLAVALVLGRRLVAGSALRLLWACMPTFVLCNLIVFRPWDWDNTKMLLYWFLAVCLLVAALLARLWRRRGRLVRALIVGAVATMIATGLLQNFHQAIGRDRYPLLSADEVRLAELVRARTDPHALFVTGTRHNHPVPVLAGRRVLMAYEGWLFAFGIDYGQRERDLRAIYALSPDAPRLLAAYAIDYIIVGPGERADLGADPDAIRARFGPPAIETETYQVYHVR